MSPPFFTASKLPVFQMDVCKSLHTKLAELNQ